MVSDNIFTIHNKAIFGRFGKIQSESFGISLALKIYDETGGGELDVVLIFYFTHMVIVMDWLFRNSIG